MSSIEELRFEVGQRRACQALGMPRSSFYRARQPKGPPRYPSKPGRSLSQEEEQQVLSVLHEARFVDHSPAAIWATLLDEERYYCSVRTMYRILHKHQEVRERRNQLRHPKYQKPELLAQKPNEVWTWDITELRGPAKHERFYLYVILDLYSRYVVGWMVAQEQSSRLGPATHYPKRGSSTDPARTTDDSFGSRAGHDGQANGLSAGRSGHHQVSEPTLLFQ